MSGLISAMRSDDTLVGCFHVQHVDHYSRTKAIAEKLVMAACGAEVKSDDGSRLKTCALRCAGIYGEGERRHLPRIVVRVRDVSSHHFTPVVRGLRRCVHVKPL